MSDEPGLELAKKAIEEAAKTAGEFLGKLVDEPIRETGGILTDTIKFWRFKNQVNLALKAKAFLESKGIQPNRVLPKTLLPLLECGSLEEDPNLQDKWASMLANASLEDGNERVKPSYVDILKGLSPLEVSILDKMFDESMRDPEPDKTAVAFSKENICRLLGLSADVFDVIADNFFRLRLCQPPTSRGGVTIGEFPMILQTYTRIHLTPFGIAFIGACRF